LRRRNFNMKIEELEGFVNSFIKERASKNELYEILISCINNASHKALDLVVILGESDYDGFTYNFELKYPSLVTTLFWGEIGIEKITEMAINKQKTKDVKIVAEILSYAIRGKLDELNFIDKESEVFQKLNFSNKKYQSESFKAKAKESLINLMVNLDKDISFPVSILNSVL